MEESTAFDTLLLSLETICKAFETFDTQFGKKVIDLKEENRENIVSKNQWKDIATFFNTLAINSFDFVKETDDLSAQVAQSISYCQCENCQKRFYIYKLLQDDDDMDYTTTSYLSTLLASLFQKFYEKKNNTLKTQLKEIFGSKAQGVPLSINNNNNDDVYIHPLCVEIIDSTIPVHMWSSLDHYVRNHLKKLEDDDDRVPPSPSPAPSSSSSSSS